MAMPSSGAISFAQMQTEFGGSNPIGFNEYYAGGSHVPSGTGSIPSSGTINLNTFYGTQSTPTSFSTNLTRGSATFIAAAQDGFSGRPAGSIFPNYGSLANTSLVMQGLSATITAVNSSTQKASEMIVELSGTHNQNAFNSITIVGNSGNVTFNTSNTTNVIQTGTHTSWYWSFPSINAVNSGTITFA